MALARTLALVPGLVLLSVSAFPQTPGQVLAEGKLTEGLAGFPGTLAGGDGFGSSVVSLGDVDGDGIDELAVGAPGDDEGSTDAGAVWLLFLDANGDVRQAVKHSTFSGGPQLALAAGSLFGTSLAAVGDVNGDGTPDLAVGAPAQDTFDGRIWVLLLQADGFRLAQPSFDAASVGMFFVVEMAVRLSSAGDVDGNGVQDLLVGSGSVFFTAQNPFVVLLDPAGNALGTQEPDTRAFGDKTALALVDDFDEDGFPELAVGNALFGGAQAFEGRMALVFRDPDGTATALRVIGEGLGGFAPALTFDDRFGLAIAQVGDLDGNGVRDLVVGARDDGSFAPGLAPGGFWELFLTADGTVIDERFVTSGRAGFAGALTGLDGFGSALAWLPRATAGGVGTLFVGAPGDDEAGGEAGALWRLSIDGAADPPAVLVQNGSHVNPLALRSTSLPRIGADWTAEVAAFAFPAATTTYLIAYDRPDQLLLGLGELLVLIEPFGGENQFVDAAPVVGGVGRHVLPVPDDLAFVGYVAHVQGLLAGGGPVLTNAVRITVGLP